MANSLEAIILHSLIYNRKFLNKERFQLISLLIEGLLILISALLFLFIFTLCKIIH